MDAASYATGATNTTDPAVRQRTDRGVRLGGPAERGSPGAGAVVRRRDPVVAPERLGELRGLAVADPVGHLPDGQRPGGEHLGRHAHPPGGEVVTERRIADPRVRALELAARGGHAPADAVARPLRRV